MVKYQVCLRGDDGKDYLITYDGLRRTLELDDRIDFVVRRLSEIEGEIINILQPKAEEKILNLIKKNPNIRTGDLTDYFRVANRFMHLAFWHAWDKLQQSKQVVGTSHGAGRHRTWNIKEE